MKLSARRPVGCASSRPIVCGRIIFSARSQSASASVSAPDDHFSTCPYCGVTISGRRRIGSSRICPTVRVGIISTASVQVVKGTFKKRSSPNDHVGASPYCRLTGSADRRIGGARGDPTIGVGIVSSAGVQIAIITATPDDHFAPAPHCCVEGPGSGSVSSARSCPAICDWIVSSAAIEVSRQIGSAPNNHFIAAPDCGMSISGIRCVCGAGSRPAVGTGTVSAAGI